ncbi:MAG: GNAT family N-acetyltransferase [Alphaproteobacteria bacterium]|nr:GNAT family N-acetyltransferase [Alphaproteobacteria bacterium]
MTELRPITSSDVEQLYAISLATGDRGEDASHLYHDWRMLGHIYSAPYADLCPQDCFVAEDEDGVAGFAVGTLDTREFEDRLVKDWWPNLRRRYLEPTGDPSGWNADQYRCFMIHHPRTAPDHVVESHPAHLHMNLLPRMQGRGIGTRLLNLWMSNAYRRGAQAVHIGVNASNERAMRFWEARGFSVLSQTSDAESSGTVWCGRDFVD